MIDLCTEVGRTLSVIPLIRWVTRIYMRTGVDGQK